MSEYRLKQRIEHVIHGPGEIIAKDPMKKTVTIRFDNDKARPINFSEQFLELKPVKDF